MPGVAFDVRLRACVSAVDAALRHHLPREGVRPATLHRAMRHSVFAGGKRLRPVLVMAAAEACGGDMRHVLPEACAVECVHTYSLMHDDLPCMDDDDFRRGRPTCHKVFGEAVAVLAGDALLALAFEILAGARPSRRHPVSTRVLELARAAGSRHLVGGQVADLEAEGRRVGAGELHFIHGGKTAAMVRASLRLGAMGAGADARRLGALTRFGEALGRAFQIIDDILDVTQPAEKLGKSAGKDARDGKSTYPSVLGMEASRAEAARLTALAKRALAPLGTQAGFLVQIADHMLTREF
jgi:geranylgeranyl diphosphate synthase, type II